MSPASFAAHGRTATRRWRWRDGGGTGTGSDDRALARPDRRSSPERCGKPPETGKNGRTVTELAGNHDTLALERVLAAIQATDLAVRAIPRQHRARVDVGDAV